MIRAELKFSEQAGQFPSEPSFPARPSQERFRDVLLIFDPLCRIYVHEVTVAVAGPAGSR